MWTHISVNAHVVWDDALWTVVGIWQDDEVSPPVALERSGRVALTGDTGPQEVLERVLSALNRPGDGRLVAPAPEHGPLRPD
jgi:hypothetical protein